MQGFVDGVAAPTGVLLALLLVCFLRWLIVDKAIDRKAEKLSGMPAKEVWKRMNNQPGDKQ